MSARLFSLLDSDGSREITFDELSAALATMGRSELDRARFAFCLYDLDGNGRVPLHLLPHSRHKPQSKQ
jgi:Ca2+-binding EF-hand superfamily protein